MCRPCTTPRTELGHAAPILVAVVLAISLPALPRFQTHSPRPVNVEMGMQTVSVRAVAYRSVLAFNGVP